LSLLAACSWVPEDGPAKKEMLGEAAAKHGLLVVDLTPPVIQSIDANGPPGFSGSFPPYHLTGEQVIGVGDAVQVTVWEAGSGGLFFPPATTDAIQQGSSRAVTIPEQVVARDGAITVPYAGRIDVVGLTPPEVEQIIVKRLSSLAIKPQALVSVTRTVSNTVSVMGEVRSGGRIPLSVKGDHLLEVIAAAGGITLPTRDTMIRLIRGGQTLSVPMQILLLHPEQDILVAPGDVVILAKKQPKILALGALMHTGQIPFDQDETSLAEAVGLAGGLDTTRSDAEGVFLMRYETAPLARILAKDTPVAPQVPADAKAFPVIYRVNLKDPMQVMLARQVKMRDGDVLYVAESKITELQKIFGIFSLLTTPIWTGAAVATVPGVVGP
jgi:polysaccharide export outer membrane protein